jgi:hypothetical protein
MVSKSKRRVFSVKPGPKIAEDAIKSERMAFRVHPDLVQILDARAAELGINRSAYVERLLVGWIKADPRNPRIDMRGKFVEGGPDPDDLKKRSPLVFAERWQKYSQAYAIILGTPAPQSWFDEEDAYRPRPYDAGDTNDENHDERPQKWAKKVLKKD